MNRQRFESVEAIHYWLAEAVCRKLGCEDDELMFFSIMACSEALQSGHICLDLRDVAGRTLWHSASQDNHDGYSFAELEPLLAHLQQRLQPLGGQSPVVLDLGKLYLRRYWMLERELAGQIAARMAGSVVVDTAKATAMLDSLFAARTDGSPDWQKVACGNALFSGFALIDGGPGTGKTYTVTRLLCSLLASSPEPLTVALAAPTGKAAQRMAESIAESKSTLAKTVAPTILNAIPETASTLHRLIGLNPNSGSVRHNADNPLELDVLLVDEVSMVDLPLFTRLFRALPPSCRVILLGDADQLPSVAAGCVVADLAVRPPRYSETRMRQLESLGLRLPEDCRATEGGDDYSSQLRQVQRFAADSGIAALARETINGNADVSFDYLVDGRFDDLECVPEDQLEEQLRRWTAQYYSEVIRAESPQLALQQLAQFRLLTPVRQGPRGVDALNAQVEAQLRRDDASVYHGRAIMITRNDYELGLFNGDIGVFWRDADGLMLAWFDGHDTPFAPGRLPDYEPVFAMTIHKTQGSQFRHVVMVLPNGLNPGCNRKLVYTAITRAQSRFTYCGSDAAWRHSVAKHEERGSGLRERLKALLKL